MTSWLRGKPTEPSQGGNVTQHVSSVLDWFEARRPLPPDSTSEGTARVVAGMTFWWLLHPENDTRTLASIDYADQKTLKFEYFCLKAFALSFAMAGAVSDPRKQRAILELVTELVLNYPASPLAGASSSRYAERLQQYSRINIHAEAAAGGPLLLRHFSSCCGAPQDLQLMTLASAFYPLKDEVQGWLAGEAMQSMLSAV